MYLLSYLSLSLSLCLLYERLRGFVWGTGTFWHRVCWRTRLTLASESNINRSRSSSRRRRCRHHHHRHRRRQQQQQQHRSFPVDQTSPSGLWRLNSFRPEMKAPTTAKYLLTVVCRGLCISLLLISLVLIALRFQRGQGRWFTRFTCTWPVLKRSSSAVKSLTWTSSRHRSRSSASSTM